MALAYHVVFGTYGFWLPNDPRGSWSRFVGAWELVRFGKSTKVNTRDSLARAPHDQELREAAKAALKYPPVHLSPQQVLAVGDGFDKARRESGYAVHACSILPEHVHLVIGRHDRSINQIAGHFKARATQQLSAAGIWALESPVWAAKCWKVFLDTPVAVARAIEYVEVNPARDGKPPQCWSFVTPFAS